MNNKLEVFNIGGGECYEKDGVVYLKLETVARGLGFTRVATSGNEVVRWERVERYLEEIGFHTSVENGVPTCGHDGFIPENIFYRLAMKAKNAVAEAFQAKVADEIIPSVRKHGSEMNNSHNTEIITVTLLHFAYMFAAALVILQRRHPRTLMFISCWAFCWMCLSY